MKQQVLIDTGPLVALLDRNDRFHAWMKEIWKTIEPPAFTCEAVMTEACFLLRGLYGQGVSNFVIKPRYLTNPLRSERRGSSGGRIDEALLISTNVISRCLPGEND
jgi:predicted nucleic acid-binding protein